MYLHLFLIIAFKHTELWISSRGDILNQILTAAYIFTVHWFFLPFEHR